MRDPKAQTWAASYAKLAPQFRTWLDRYHIEIAGHRIYDDGRQRWPNATGR